MLWLWVLGLMLTLLMVSCIRIPSLVSSLITVWLLHAELLSCGCSRCYMLPLVTPYLLVLQLLQWLLLVLQPLQVLLLLATPAIKVDIVLTVFKVLLDTVLPAHWASTAFLCL